MRDSSSKINDVYLADRFPGLKGGTANVVRPCVDLPLFVSMEA
jgi:hypothetical protein